MVRTLNHYRPESVAMRRVLQENASSAGDASSAVNVIQRNIPGDPPEILIEIALAFVVLVVGWYLSKVAVRIAGRTVARRIERPSVTRTALRGVRAAVLLWAAVVAASILGVGDTQILLSVTVISAVIAVVLAPVVGSLINGLYVLADRPYEIGDMIEVSDAGHRGFVEDITIRYTKIFTLQNTFIVIPNSEIHARDVINYSAEDERTRVSLRLDITYESDLEAARKATERAARGVDDVISGGPDIRIGSARYAAAPSCYITEYGDHGIALELFFWMKHPTSRPSSGRRCKTLSANGWQISTWSSPTHTATTSSTKPAASHDWPSTTRDSSARPRTHPSNRAGALRTRPTGNDCALAHDCTLFSRCPSW